MQLVHTKLCSRWTATTFLHNTEDRIQNQAHTKWTFVIWTLSAISVCQKRQNKVTFINLSLSWALLLNLVTEGSGSFFTESNCSRKVDRRLQKLFPCSSFSSIWSKIILTREEGKVWCICFLANGKNIWKKSFKDAEHGWTSGFSTSSSL